jgi:hypothetical protein
MEMEDTYIIENAKITSVKISMADHGCLTFWIFLDYGGSCQGLGGWCIGHGYVGADKDTFESNGNGLVAMMRIMDLVGVSDWDDLVGKYIRVKKESRNATIHIIGNILTDKWLDIRECFTKG